MRNKSKETKYYRIIDDPVRYDPQVQPSAGALKDLLASISSRHKYLYIDINERQGYKLMEQCTGTGETEEMEKIGDSYISHTGNHSSNNRNSLSYLFKLQEINRQKENAFKLIGDQIHKSQLKLKLKKKDRMGEEEGKGKLEKKQIYKGMDVTLLEQYKYDSQMDSIDQEIKQRQTKLLEKYCTVSPRKPTQKHLDPPKQPYRKQNRPSLILLSN